MSNSKASLQVAKTIALTLVNRDTDINELAKVAAYLRTHLDGTQFFRLLETMVKEKDSRYLVRTGRTLDYYRDIQDVCQQHLEAYRNAKDGKAQEMAEILGWAVRLMRYYKGSGVPLSAQPSSQSPRPLSASSVEDAKQRAIRRTPEPRQMVVSTERALVTLVEDAKRDRARVETNNGEQVVCTGFPVYPAAKQGMRCRADVTKQDGKPLRATFKRWE